jgi:hypothetical protein
MENPQLAVLSDPFAMLIHPEAVLSAIEQSGRLGALASRICRPLDKPLIPKRQDDEPHSFEDSIERNDGPPANDESFSAI